MLCRQAASFAEVLSQIQSRVLCGKSGDFVASHHAGLGHQSAARPLGGTKHFPNFAGVFWSHEIFLRKAFESEWCQENTNKSSQETR